MVAQGYANKTIASVLEISSWTVASHLRRIFVKLQVSSRAAMATSLSGAGCNELPSLLDDVLADGGAADVRSSDDKACLRSVPPDDLSLTARLWSQGPRPFGFPAAQGKNSSCQVMMSPEPRTPANTRESQAIKVRPATN